MLMVSGNIYDSKILDKQLNSKNSIDNSLNNPNKKTFLADAAYDSKKLR